MTPNLPANPFTITSRPRLTLDEVKRKYDTHNLSKYLYDEAKTDLKFLMDMDIHEGQIDALRQEMKVLLNKVIERYDKQHASAHLPKKGYRT